MMMQKLDLLIMVYLLCLVQLNLRQVVEDQICVQMTDA